MPNAGGPFQGQTSTAYGPSQEGSFLSSSFPPQIHRKERALGTRKETVLICFHMGQHKDRAWPVR